MILSPITTFEQLSRNLNMGAGFGGYLDILKSIKLNDTEWTGRCNWKEEKYTRNCISACDDYELILMCWKKGQQSPIHSYNFQEGWIKVLKGKLDIDIFHLDKEDNSITKEEDFSLNEKEYTYLNDDMGFHRIKNITDEDTVSLHLHIRKIEKWEVYDEDKKELQIIQPEFDSISNDCE